MSFRFRRSVVLLLSVISAVALGAAISAEPLQTAPSKTIPRTADGKPDLQGIWKATNKAATDIQDVVEGKQIPYLPAAATKKQQNFTKRKTDDPLGKCFMPGVPRIMYLDYPFQIFQTKDHVAMTFEWSQVYRLVYLDGKPAPKDLDFWMGDSRGHWDGDTLVVDVTSHNDKTWFDAAGNHHSEELRLTERYTLVDADTIRYDVTVHDPKVFSKDWTMSMPLHRQKNVKRIMEYQCQAEREEANGAFERDPRTWYPQTPKASK